MRQQEHIAASLEPDGRRLGDGVVPLERGLVKHRVLVRMGPPAAPGEALSPPLNR